MLDIKNKKTFEISTPYEGKRLWERIIDVFMIASSALLLTYSLLNRFTPTKSASFLISALLGMIFIISIYRIFNSTKSSKYGFSVSLGIVIFCAIMLIIFAKNIYSGAGIIANNISDELTFVDGRIHEKYVIAKNSRFSAYSIIFVVSSFFTACLLEVVNRGRKHLIAIPAIAIIFFVWKTLIPVDTAVCLAISLVFLTFIYANIKNKSGGNLRVLVHLSIAIICVSALSILLFGLTGAGERFSTSNLREAMVTKFDTIIFGGKQGAMPMGKIDETKRFSPGNTPVMKVSLSSKEPVFLRGYVGDEYDGKSWEGLKGEKAKKARDFFYYMHRNNIYGQSMLAEQVLSTKSKVEEGTITLEITDANKKFYYLPYGISMLSGTLDDRHMIGDSAVISRNSEDSSEYTMPYIANAVNKAYVTQKAIAERGDTDKNSDIEKDKDALLTLYFKQNKYLFTDIPKEEERAIEALLGKREKLTTVQAKEKIDDLLDRNIKYDEQEGTSGYRKRIMNVFLNSRKRGYAPQYATFATMALRYYNIPARYVEGYVITDKTIEKTEKGNKIPIYETDSHAWVEYYLEGVGWLPYDPTGKYSDQIRFESTGNGSDEGESLQDDSNKPSPKKEKTKPHVKKFDNPVNMRTKVFVPSIWIILLMFLIPILIITVIITVKRIKLKKFLESFAGDDANRGIKNAMAYATFLMKKDGVAVDKTFAMRDLKFVETEYGENIGKSYKNSLEISEQSDFSLHGVSRDEQIFVANFAKTFQKLYAEKRNRFKRFMDKFIFFRY